MRKTEKQKQAFHEELDRSRRNFLGGGLAVTAAALLTSGSEAKAAVSSTLSPIHPERYGSAHVKYVPLSDEWLGTTRIVGPIQQTSEMDQGFNLAGRGFIDPKTQYTRSRFVGKYPLSGALSDTLGFMSGMNAVSGTPAPEKLAIPDPEKMSKHIKELGLFLRADDVGIGVMRHHASYTERAIRTVNAEGNMEFRGEKEDNTNHKYVISLIIDQDLRTLLASTGFDSISASQSFRSYATSGFLSVILANYIRRLGYSARAHHASNYNMVLAPNLMASGMGEHGRPAECVVHPRFGFRFKAAIVSTDLPLLPDEPIDFGLAEFCRSCKKCAEHCPSKAISFETNRDVYNGYERWTGDFKKCTQFRCTNEQGASCGACMKVCPWNSKEDSWYHSASLNVIGQSNATHPILREMDDLFGYGTEQLQEFKWWLEWPELMKYNYPPNM